MRSQKTDGQIAGWPSRVTIWPDRPEVDIGRCRARRGRNGTQVPIACSVGTGDFRCDRRAPSTCPERHARPGPPWFFRQPKIPGPVEPAGQLHVVPDKDPPAFFNFAHEEVRQSIPGGPWITVECSSPIHAPPTIHIRQSIRQEPSTRSRHCPRYPVS